MNARQLDLGFRQYLRFFAFVVPVGFVLNEIWEVAQMYMYVSPAGSSSMNEFLRCSRAAVGDVAIVLGICGIGALASGDPCWGLSGGWRVHITSSILGLWIATILELWSIAAGRWAYSESMPLVPALKVGLWPLLQMVLLPPLTFWIARWWVIRRTT